MVNCLHSNQALLLITAAISGIHPEHFLKTLKADIICQVVKKRNYLSDFLSSTVKINLISNIFSY